MLHFELLRMLGKPRLVVNGTEAVIEPRAAFEVLAQIVCAGEVGISRSDLARRLWDHLDDKHARIQLRIALHRLKSEAIRLGIADFFDLASQQLKALTPITTDLDKLSVRRPHRLREIESFLLPFAQGWDPSHWYAQTDALADVLANMLAGDRMLRTEKSSCRYSGRRRACIRQAHG